MNALVTTTMQPLTYADIEKLGADIANSGLFGIKTKAQAVTLMMIAQAEGRHPALAARDYDIIQGRPAKKPEAMMREFLEAGGKIEWHKLDDAGAEATFSHPQGGKVRIGWDLQRAATAGLGGKPNWKQYPRQMLRSRVVSEGIRTVWPSATSGLYEPGEVADFTGPTIDHEEAAPAPTTREQINKDVPLKDVRKVTLREWLDEFETRCAAAQTEDEANAILKEERVLRLDDPDLKINPSALVRALGVRKAMVDRIWPEPLDELEDDEAPAIKGEEYAAAG